ncbi:MAG: response regulator [Candidatus Methylomirabilota bacterium]|jgi:two-component system cell cycle response regulator DivK
MGGRVLVVEDHSMSLELVTELLQEEGNQVLAATSGEAGLRLAAAEGPDLILMDLQLPGMTGYEAIRRLKANPATAAIPVLALTGSAMRGDDLKVREAGADGYLTKPLDARAFRETLRRILAGGARG